MKFNRLLPWIGVAVIGLIGLYGLATGSFFGMLRTLIAAVILILLIAQPRLLLVLTVLLMAADFTVPLMPSTLGLYIGVGALFCGAVVLEKVFRRGYPVSKEDRRIMIWAVAFAVVLVVTALVRGSGVRILGSDKWGGRPYFLLLLASAVLVQSLFVKLSVAQCKRIVIGLCLAGLFPTVAALVARYEGTNLLSRFVVQADEVGQSVNGVVGEVDPLFRLQVANVGATYLFLLMWLLLYARGVPARTLMIGSGITAIVLTGLSGHRISLLYGVVLSVAYVLLNVRTSLLARLANRYLLLLIMTMAVLVVLSPKLPVLFQRSLSWMPFTGVSQNAQFDAAVTTQWRIEVWKRAMEELPNYLLIGKGFAFQADELFSFVNWSMNDYNYVLTSHSYHNGVVQILVDLGLPGMLCTVGFIVAVFRRHYRLLSYQWNSPMLCHFHRVMLAGFAAQVVVYLIVGGGATTFVTLFFWTAILVQLARADGDAAPPPAPAVAEQPTP
jgi:hypothetical protein